MLKIFAKQGTTEKALVVCNINEVPLVINSLIDQYGGNWLLVDKVRPGEILHFNDNKEYQGFNKEIDRYS